MVDSKGLGFGTGLALSLVSAVTASSRLADRSPARQVNRMFFDDRLGLLSHPCQAAPTITVGTTLDVCLGSYLVCHQ